MSDIEYTYIIIDNEIDDSEDAILVMNDYYSQNSVSNIQIPVVGISAPNYTVVKDVKEDLLVYSLWVLK